MPTPNERSRQIREFILSNLKDHGRDIAARTANEFGISRQAVARHLHTLVDGGLIEAEGTTRARRYKLRSLSEIHEIFSLIGLDEDIVFRQALAPVLVDLEQNVIDMWSYSVTEILNNAIDHSDGTEVSVQLIKTAVDTQVTVHDDGIGIFRKIQGELNLLDERHAVLELSKGKLTTDPDNHTGEGIFFTSRMMDEFSILSGKTLFSHAQGHEWDLIDTVSGFQDGTVVSMVLTNFAKRTTAEVFDAFTSGDFPKGFTKTIVPVRLVQYGDEALVSRSQARRLLGGLEKFRTIILDFSGVRAVGQAFCDEVLRVFPNRHPGTEIVSVHANQEVSHMIERVQAG